MNRKNTLAFVSAGLGAVTVGAAVFLRWRGRREAFAYRELIAQNQSESASPETDEDRAVSAVTGGLPEDMNEMPPTDNFETEGPTWDGSNLPPSRQAER